MVRALTLFVSLALAAWTLPSSVLAQENAKFSQEDKFRQLEEWLPTPNDARAASGAPGHRYWQQRADYDIKVRIDDDTQRLTGTERITYHNRSPDTLRYLWVQLENNLLAPDSAGAMTATAPELDRLSFEQFERMLHRQTFDGSVKLGTVRDTNGRAVPSTVVGTMLRVDPPSALKPGDTWAFVVEWNFAINNHDQVSSRTGYEYFEKDDNYLYEMAHWFPRMAAYTDVNGWQHKQFLGRGEFTLEFGDYRVAITVPDDHIVASTGVLQNPEEVLTETQRRRMNEARSAETPQFIVTPEEAKENEGTKPTGEKTWVYHAENVRDFAFATSRKFIWDCQGHRVGEQDVLAMSYYPNEGEPLWSRYSTHSIVHTLDVYSRYSFDYPYPVAISVNGPVGGMEYPMICFNGPRPAEDGTYTPRNKYGLISVIIHEVGHNYFPMIVNSDERQWTWMDEGLNTFLQFLTEQEWEPDYPSRRGEPKKIVDYMRSTNQVPIMTNSESILQFGPNAYAKPATALNILRETILGREVFDFAFREYSQRWMFKRPEPSDFFRSLEDASGIDLDWFWRGWFYSTDHVDLALTNVRHFQVDTANPETEKGLAKAERDAEPTTVSAERYAGIPTRADRFPELLDFYNEFDPLDVTPQDRTAYAELLAGLEENERALLKVDQHFYVLDFENLGGLVMPILLELEYADGTTEPVRIPAEIWRRDHEQVSKLIITEQELVRVTLDPQLETADVDLSNNHWPPRAAKSRFELFKEKTKKNAMQKAREAAENGDESTLESHGGDGS